MKTLKLQLRFLVPLAMALLVVASVAVPLMESLMLKWASRDLQARGALVANTVSESVARAMQGGDAERVKALFDRAVEDERLLAMGLCGNDGRMLISTALFPAQVHCKALEDGIQSAGEGQQQAGGGMQVGVYPVQEGGTIVGSLVLVHDLSVFEKRSEDTRRYLLLMIAGLGAVMSIITVVVAQLSWRGWVQGARALLRGEGLISPMVPTAPELAPVADELKALLRHLEDEYRKLQGVEQPWDPERLRGLLRTQLRGDQVIVVSNREPYLHEQTAEGVVVRRPASGLVTAVEPVMRACSGTWIAHGSGSADRKTVDSHDRVGVPPGKNDYRLRRIWLSSEEEKGYYYGLANEGLWPLCHVAHVRPVFRESDWEMYRLVNQKFAQAVVDEADCDDPVVLVQDYHLALLPKLIREKLPRATIITFWHIPWPNPESFGICPWRTDIIEGLLGSTILGFHTPFHGKNFQETVDRYVEARIEHEHNTITLKGHTTLVQAYPISIRWPDVAEVMAWPTVDICRARLRERFGLRLDHQIALGVDRFDYTKGILERMHAVERLLEKYPQWQGCFSLVQVAAPTRSELDEYQEFQRRIHRLTVRINTQYGKLGYLPIILLAEHHEPEQLVEMYRSCEVCMVTSLHDGMNLVSKEFIASRDDEQGVLLLSRFAGAASELSEAIIINPYHVEECADALHQALMMPQTEQKERMASLRMTVRENNVFRWAGRMLTDTATVRMKSRIDARLKEVRD